ncbi:MAG: hypothetical protein ACOX2A_04070 [Tepidanaerobacteraceae bacterium]
MLKVLGYDNIGKTEVIIPPGTIKHVLTKRPKDFDKYFYYIPEVICNPDYYGKYPNKKDCIELVKKIYVESNSKGEFVLVGVKINTSKEILLSSFYSVNWVKVDSRRKRGRLIEYI